MNLVLKRNGQTVGNAREPRYLVEEQLEYCRKSDAYKMVHPDVILHDKYVWRDFNSSELQKRIV
jgi:tubulin polyglutamylase TTLL1